MNLCGVADNTKSSIHAISTYYIIAGIIIIAKCTISSIHQKLSSPGERKQNVRIFNFSDAEFSHLPLLCSSLVGWAPPILDAGEKVALHKMLACSVFATSHARYKYKYRQKFKYRNLLFIRCLVAHVCQTHTWYLSILGHHHFGAGSTRHDQMNINFEPLELRPRKKSHRHEKKIFFFSQTFAGVTWLGSGVNINHVSAKSNA